MRYSLELYFSMQDAKKTALLMFRAIRKFFGLLHRLRALKRYVTIDNQILAGLALHPGGHCFL